MPAYQTGFQEGLAVSCNITRVLRLLHRQRKLRKEQRKVIFFVDLASAYDRVRRCDIIDMLEEAVSSGKNCAD